MRSLRALTLSSWSLIALVLVICWLHLWTASPEKPLSFVSETADNYYNKLTSGFLKGHLWLDVPGDPYLDALANPWDPAAQHGHGLPDASYYKGHFYIYFGVSPTVLLFLPFRILTGHYISDGFANVVFVWVGFLASAWIVLAARKRYYPNTSGLIVAICILAVGLATLSDVILRRPSFREIPGTCGYACSMLALVGLFGALHSRRAVLSMALSSACFALAVGSRPLYVLVCPVVILPVWFEAKVLGSEVVFWRRREWWKLAMAAIIPMSVIGFALALYNYQRFGSVAEFGLRYQFWGVDPATSVRFAWRFAPYNLDAFWYSRATWSHYFPFATMVDLPAFPDAYCGPDDAYGIFTNLPFTVFALGTLWLARCTLSPEEKRLRAFCAGVALTWIIMSVIMLFFQAAFIRYMLDFSPAIVLLAALGLLVVSGRPWFRGWRSVTITVCAVVLCVYSAFFSFFAGQRHNELFRADHPSVYQRVAHRWDYIPQFFDRISGVEYGPVEMIVHFPKPKVGTVESIVTTGASYLSDYLFVHYLGEDSIRFGLVHTSIGTYVGKAVHCDLTKPHLLRVDMGSLYPPSASPYFDGMAPVEARQRQTTVSVTLDGEIVFYRLLYLYDPFSVHPILGPDAPKQSAFVRFGGSFASVHRLPHANVPAPGGLNGKIELSMTLPSFVTPDNQALVSAGEPGHGDMVYIHRVDATHISFGYDHGGSELIVGPPVAVDPGATQAVTIEMGSLAPLDEPLSQASPQISRNGRLVITVNARPNLTALAQYYPSATEAVVVGSNTVRSACATKAFSGHIISQKRESGTGTGQKTGAYVIRLKVPPFTGPRNEPLICAGETGRGDLIYIRYLAADQISFGYDHWGVGGATSGQFKIDPEAEQELEIDWGTLHPENFGDQSNEPPQGLPSRFYVRLNHQTVFNERQLYYPSDPSSIAIGLNPIGASTAGTSFTGELISSERESTPSPARNSVKGSALNAGSYRLRLKVPPFTGVRSEPLVSAGKTGRADLVYVHYIAADQVSFGYDHWGVSAATSKAFKIDPSGEQELEIDWGALHPENFADRSIEPAKGLPGKLVLKLNHEIVLDETQLYYACDPSSVAVGLNPAGASTATSSFTGELISSERGSLP